MGKKYAVGWGGDVREEHDPRLFESVVFGLRAHFTRALKALCGRLNLVLRELFKTSRKKHKLTQETRRRF